jgi:hypothetical protein
MSASYESWDRVKPLFYRDARRLYRNSILPIFLDDEAKPLELSAVNPTKPFLALEASLKHEMATAYALASPQAPECPYHEDLTRRLNLRPIFHNGIEVDIADTDKETFMQATYPGAFEAAVTISNMLGAFARIKSVFGLEDDPYTLAERSAGLIDTPLRHPVQWAVPFIFTLVPEYAVVSAGGFSSFDRRVGFLDEALIHRYLTPKVTPDGICVEWAKPIEEFTINAKVTVYDRAHGSETDASSATIYPIGTKLADIAVTERTLTCPGKEIAQVLWHKGVVTARHYGLLELGAA